MFSSLFLEIKEASILSIEFGFLNFFRDSVLFLTVPAFPKVLIRNVPSGFSWRKACGVIEIHVEGKKSVRTSAQFNFLRCLNFIFAFNGVFCGLLQRNLIHKVFEQFVN